MLLRRLLRSTSLGSLAMIEAASKRRTWMQKGAAAGLSLAATTLLLAGCAGNAQVSSRSGAAGYTRGHAAPGPQL
ncbi:MAG TPA: hypothetical protein VL574_09595, partial [Stellaceae bacterium]|nr:hypothetical protein [Stellaceae bacterium]